MNQKNIYFLTNWEKCGGSPQTAKERVIYKSIFTGKNNGNDKNV